MLFNHVIPLVIKYRQPVSLIHRIIYHLKRTTATQTCPIYGPYGCVLSKAASLADWRQRFSGKVEMRVSSGADGTIDDKVSVVVYGSLGTPYLTGISTTAQFYFAFGMTKRQEERAR